MNEGRKEERGDVHGCINISCAELAEDAHPSVGAAVMYGWCSWFLNQDLNKPAAMSVSCKDRRHYRRHFQGSRKCNTRSSSELEMDQGEYDLKSGAPQSFSRGFPPQKDSHKFPKRCENMWPNVSSVDTWFTGEIGVGGETLRHCYCPAVCRATCNWEGWNYSNLSYSVSSWMAAAYIRTEVGTGARTQVLHK